jgi:hypothetical protein
MPMKFNLFYVLMVELDWKAIAAICMASVLIEFFRRSDEK